jgi:ERCC4-type nuclease
MGHINVVTLFSELEFVYWLKHIQKRAMDFDYREPLAEKLTKYSRKLEYSIPFLVQSIPDIGEELARALLLHFGSILAIFNASIDELKEVPKIGQKKAEYIYNFVREDYRNLHYAPKQIGVN